MESGGQDIRWKQRFSNFQKAFQRLAHAIEVVKADPGNEVLQAGLIQIYEFTFELAWKTLKDYLEDEGFDLPSPKRTLRQAFQSGYIENGSEWIKALDARNQTAHVYDEKILIEIVAKIQNTYFFLLEDLKQTLENNL
ncbi:nucleotidyltransferase substrate binding protein [Desulfobacterales bacterium HSG17]|nr:nucleotidyltransferase substrate binding protein [Desulfobacterales bacterium HSG17]